MDQAQAKFEGWAVVEMFGHQREAGFVTTEAYGAAVLFRIDTPELLEREFILKAPEYVAGSFLPAGATVKRPAVAAKSKLIGPGAVYALNPCTEEACRAAIERIAPRPLILVALPEGQQLPAASAVAEQDLGDYEDVGNEEYEDSEHA